MAVRLCQLKSLSALLLLCLLACSKKYNNHELKVQQPKWFSASREHSIISSEGTAVEHLFFDVSPEFSKDGQSVNAVLTTVKGSEYAYNLDLLSGQRFYDHTYCKQKDVWKKESGLFKGPPFNIGFIPRTLDQLGTPQKILVFGNRPFENIDDNYFRVRIVSAYVEQECLEGDCLNTGNWLSRLVFLGVDEIDPTLDRVKDMESFKKLFDWKDIRAHIENIDGRNGTSTKVFPAIRGGGLVDVATAYDYFKKRSVLISDTEAVKIQGGCHALYEKAWKDVGFERAEDRESKTTEELNAKLRLIDELREAKKPVNFAARFHRFTKNHYQDFLTCEKFVYHGNINENPDKFWFLSYLGFFYRLHDEGHRFNCNRKDWTAAHPEEDGRFRNNIKEAILSCDSQAIDSAMDLIPNYLKTIQSHSNRYYSFLDYDNHSFGSHRKLYSWVSRRKKVFECQNDPNSKITKFMPLFPPDAKWKKRTVKDLVDKLKIIY